MTERVYVETSVVGGVFDKEFDLQSELFWDKVQKSEIVVIVSDLLTTELEGAPKHVRDFFDGLPKSQVERVFATEESNRLAAQYISENVVGESSLDDCRHIAMATLAHADVLVSWNFKHIVNRREGYNGVNKRLGYPEIEIQTPHCYNEVNDDET